MNRKTLLQMNIQFFGEGDSDNENQNTYSQNTSGQNSANQAVQFDYDKLAGIIQGKQKVTEDTVLKSYLKQQGLSGDELTQAINNFKTEKEKNTPDIGAIQTQLTQNTQALNQANIEKQGTLEAVALGLDVKSIPYVLKMADMSKAIDDNGAVNAEEVKKAITKVLEDVPALKGTNQSENNIGGFQIGGAGSNQDQNKAQEDMLRDIFGIKKK